MLDCLLQLCDCDLEYGSIRFTRLMEYHGTQCYTELGALSSRTLDTAEILGSLDCCGDYARIDLPLSATGPKF